MTKIYIKNPSNKIYKGFSKRYFLSSIDRVSLNIVWHELYLNEYSNPSEDGFYMRIRTVAKIGNSENPEDVSNAVKIMNFLQEEAKK